MKKIRKILIITLSIIIILLLAGFLAYKFFFVESTPTKVKVLKSIPAYGYELKENQTEVYKKTFEDLDKVLSSETVDEEEYAKIVAKLFIIDFYTLNNKVSKNDIGGLDFIKDSMKDNFIEQVRNTFYRYIEVKSDTRSQALPEVSEIKNVELEKTSFTYSDKTVDDNAYKVIISWDYKEDLGYEKETTMIIVKEDKKLYIVEMN